SDNVAASVSLGDARDRGTNPRHEVDEAFAVRRAFVGVRVPEGGRLLPAAHEKSPAIEALPVPEMLFGEVLVLLQFLRRLEISGRQNRLRGLMRARQMTRDPDRLSRQQCRQTGEDAFIAAIAGQIGLAVDAALIDADRRMANPPPARAHKIVGSGLAGDDLV